MDFPNHANPTDQIQNSKTTGKMSILPQELITEILSRLPVKSLLRFQCVSKSWFAQIDDPGFMKMHLENNREGALILQTWNRADHPPLNYYLVNFSDENQPVKIFPPFHNPDRFSQIVDSCNGLVCIRTCDGETVIWNPSIRKYKKLPFESTNFAVGKRNSAFEYDAVNNDYKVLKIVENFAGAFEVKVYSLKAHSWRRVEDEWPYKDSRISLGPVFSNGALHWLVKSEMGETRLLAFQLTTEKFQEHTLPVEPQSIRTLEVLGGSLCVSAYGPEARAIDFWMMKETSWSRLCTLSVTTRYDERLKGCRVVFSTDGQKEVLTEMDYGKDNGSKDLFWYNIKKKRRRITLTHIGDKFWTGTCEDDELPILDVGNLSQFISAS